MVRKKVERTQMWVPIEFKSFVLKRRSMTPNKTLTEILMEMARERKKNGGRDAFPKF